jgi:ABC-2 type transport system ATP-binding protein
MAVRPVVAENIVRRYGRGRGIEGLSLSVPTGQCLGVLGANGSGKTTLTRLVAGLERVQQGSLWVLGGPACPGPRALRRRCGVALEAPAHWEQLSGRQNLWFFARQYGLAGPRLAQRVADLLAEADLGAQADDPVATYSFGMRRKLGILEALVHDPDLLILDEPSAGTDAAFLDRLVQWIRQRCERGATTWIADNDAHWLSRAATHAVLLREGRIVAEGNVSELMVSVQARNRIEILLEQPDFRAVPDLRGIEAFRCEGHRITAQIHGHNGMPVQLLQWIGTHGGCVRSMEIRSVTLGDALAQRALQREGTP